VDSASYAVDFRLFHSFFRLGFSLSPVSGWLFTLRPFMFDPSAVQREPPTAAARGHPGPAVSRAVGYLNPHAIHATRKPDAYSRANMLPDAQHPTEEDVKQFEIRAILASAPISREGACELQQVTLSISDYFTASEVGC
jgi:hypothetical protein